jgi:glutathione S-transferase
MKLYEFAPTRSIRVRWTLQEMRIPFESEEVSLTAGEHRRPEFLALNPAGKIPVLVDGEQVLTESVAIVLYLADKFPEKGLFPTELRQRGEAYRWLLFAATDLEQPLWRIARNTQVYPEPQRVPADIPNATREAREAAAIVDAHLQGRSFMVGERVSVVDFVMAYTLDWAGLAGCLDACTNAQAYLQRMYSRPLAAQRITEAFKLGGARADSSSRLAPVSSPHEPDTFDRD